ncbi:hypothetical protein BDK92_6006 [Micromonospora pisi]|uniref:Sporulation and spore germination protein n=1 Tax=Micromonospora pisi TaxID=589240 RepID=A0A495JSM3_9ACTN|nr:hypothetical protein [Micromonospora pisi]RKR91605.1 hypothetical protein BDK92_6006 [Micromonospora pisi]
MTGNRAVRGLLAGLALTATLAGCGVRPSGVIVGGAAPAGPVQEVAADTRLYLVSEINLTLVVRDTGQTSSLAETLALLTDGPDAQERARGLTSEVPLDARVVEVASEPTGTTVTYASDVTALSATAVAQIVCTVNDALTATGQEAGSAPVTLVGRGRSRGPNTCPVTP